MSSLQPSRRKRILIVEDEAVARNALAKMLGETYDVTVAADGVEGVKEAERSVPDLIVTDVTMPRLDGISMVRLIRQRHPYKVPVIFLTALGAPSDVIAGISAGARHYMTKPVDVDDLERRIAKTLGTPSMAPASSGI